MLQQEEEPIFLLKSFVSNIFLKDMDVDTLDKIGVSTSLICFVTSQRETEKWITKSVDPAIDRLVLNHISAMV